MHDYHVEEELFRFMGQRFVGLLHERVEHSMNTIFMSFLPELLNLSLKRGLRRLPMKDREGLVGLIGMPPMLGPSGQVEQVGLRCETWEGGP